MAFSAPCKYSTLSLNSLRLKVKLGCQAEERNEPQFVRFDITIRFSELPIGCVTDRLQDTVCYAQISEQVASICKKTEYSLIEKLGFDAFHSIREILPPSIGLLLKIVKEKPPVEHLEGGASFTLGDWHSTQ